MFNFLGRLLVGLTLGLFLNAAWAANDALVLKHARAAFDKKNREVLLQDVQTLKESQYLLAPYADYWLMSLDLDEASTPEVEHFLAQYAHYPFADRLRGEWLKKLGKKQDWSTFNTHFAQFQREDATVQCYALQGRQLLGGAMDVEMLALWYKLTDLPLSCTPLLSDMARRGVLSQEAIWGKFRWALQEGKLSLAKSFYLLLPNADADNLKLLDKAYANPQTFLEKKTASAKYAFGAEANLYALDKLARKKLDTALSVYPKMADDLNEVNRGFGWARLGMYAAQAHYARALELYAMAGEAVAANPDLAKEMLAWKVRAAIWEKDWPSVVKATTLMSPKQMEEGAWRYWRARALKEAKQFAEADALLNQLAQERHFYGWLAAEIATPSLSAPKVDYEPSDLEVSAIASVPAIQRALELQRIEMRWEAKLEWAWATKEFDEKQLLAASKYASTQQWYDISINTADSTKTLHNFALRYPSPYRAMMKQAAKNNNVDEAWVHGITRQESRFMHYARSGVGASGLMQLMPATAKWTAKRMGLEGYRADMINDIETNIALGTYYMHYVLESFGGQAVMASAGYNAGPGRAKKWQASQPLEAAIYIENIPFTETRLYVQKVMANAHIYAPMLGGKTYPLSARLGVIPAANTVFSASDATEP